MTDRSLEEGRAYTHFVIGSGLAAYAFIERVLSLDANAKVLCLETGDASVENYNKRLREAEDRRNPHRSQFSDINPLERSWRETAATRSSQQLNECAGTCYVLGGRSNYWHGWCKQPETWQMRDFPPSMLAAAAQPNFWSDAHTLLRTRTLDTMNEVVHKDLQAILDRRLSRAKADIPGSIDLHPAVFAHGGLGNGNFERFSASDALLALQKITQKRSSQRLDILAECEVSRMILDDARKSVTSLETSRGVINIARRGAPVVLCTGPLSNASLILRSLPELCNRVGSKFGGHFRSHIFARIPLQAFVQEESFGKREQWGAAAKVISGHHEETGLQYQIQLSLFSCSQYEGRYGEIVSKFPRYGTAPVEEQLANLGDDIIASCTILGELDSRNDDSWLKLGSHPGEGLDLQFLMTDSDRQLWNHMDTVAFAVITSLVQRDQSVQYWDGSLSTWAELKPTLAQRRSPVLVHEACVTPAGGGHQGAADERYKLHGCENVFLTGAGLFPTAGSWNPALAVCGYSQHLANLLCETDGRTS